jgi:ribonuclease HI
VFKLSPNYKFDINISSECYNHDKYKDNNNEILKKCFIRWYNLGKKKRLFGGIIQSHYRNTLVFYDTKTNEIFQIKRNQGFNKINDAVIRSYDEAYSRHHTCELLIVSRSKLINKLLKSSDILRHVYIHINRPKDYSAFFDASFNPNNGRVGIGYVIMRNQEVIIRHKEELYMNSDEFTSTEAELHSLEMLLRKIRELELVTKKIEVHGDCKSVIQAMNNHCIFHSEKMRNKIHDLKKLTDIKQKKLYKFTWVPRNQNRIADVLTR